MFLKKGRGDFVTFQRIFIECFPFRVYTFAALLAFITVFGRLQVFLLVLPRGRGVIIAQKFLFFYLFF